MGNFSTLLRTNRNYRNLWLGQVVSEVGDHFNTVAVLSLSLTMTGSGGVVGGVIISRVLTLGAAGAVAGVVLDRFDRRWVMIWSDLFRAVVALSYIALLYWPSVTMLYVLSGALFLASPFFTSGRSAILPRITSREELHTANALTQTTAWLTLAIGAAVGGFSTMRFGYEWAFVVNSVSFLVSAAAVFALRSGSGDFKPNRDPAALARPSFGRDLAEGIRYIRATPLVAGIAFAYVGWASGGGAAQMLFTLFAERVFHAGAGGLGILWGMAGAGLVFGGMIGHRLYPRLRFSHYKHVVTFAYFLHGAFYVLFALMPTLGLSSLFILLSRVAMGTNNVLNRTMLLTHVPDGLRGRVFTAVETLMSVTMMLSLAAAGAASAYWDDRIIGAAAGVLSTSTALFWGLANAMGKLPEPPVEALNPPDPAEDTEETRAAG
ncbi:MAG TPA: MFS transporter [Solibacterales bacterium]|nr:MFS transporter [Bryobacterales bacterium]